MMKPHGMVRRRGAGLIFGVLIAGSAALGLGTAAGAVAATSGSSTGCNYVNGSFSNPTSAMYPNGRYVGYTTNVNYYVYGVSNGGTVKTGSTLSFGDQRTSTISTYGGPIKITGALTSVDVTGNTATLTGTGTQTVMINGVSYSQSVTFTITVTGNGSNPDTFEVQTSAGYDSGVINSPPNTILVNNTTC